MMSSVMSFEMRSVWFAHWIRITTNEMKDMGMKGVTKKKLHHGKRSSERLPS